MINKEMYFRRRNKIVIPTSEGEKVSDVMVATAIVNLESFGYTLDKEIVDMLITNVSEKDFINVYNDLIKIIDELFGTSQITLPMYPNFPQQVMEEDEAILYLQSIIHYITLELPQYEVEKRESLRGNYDLTTIKLGTQKDFYTILTNLLSSKTSLSPLDYEDIKWFIDNLSIDELKTIMPKQIPFKETLTRLTEMLWTSNELRELLLSYYKTATDILRLALALSDEDTSLSNNKVHFKSFKRSERRMLLKMLNNANNIEEDMVRYKTLWIRLGEILHPNEYQQFRKSIVAFDKLRNNGKIDTFNSKIEKAYDSKDLQAVLELLSSRPGEFARRLDRTLRMVSDVSEQHLVVQEFSKIAEKIPTSLLIQLQCYFKNRNNTDVRVFFPKGQVSSAYGVENNLVPIDQTICDRICNICSLRLMNEYSKKEWLGNVYIDDEMKKFTIPTSQRNCSKTLKTVGRGSRFTIDKDKNFIRASIFWKQPENERVDLDLSMVIYDKDMKMLSHISYMNLKNTTMNCYHSGDITSAPNGASEFVDVDLAQVESMGGRYLTFAINSFTDTPFYDLPECFMGFMEREDVQSGEIYEEKSVINKSDLISNSTQLISSIVDVENREIIWADLSCTIIDDYCNNILTNQTSLYYGLQSVMNINKPSLYDLFIKHAIARGTIVSNKEEADIVFAKDGDITPFDLDIILGEYI